MLVLAAAGPSLTARAADFLGEAMSRGGIVMWPLLALSIVSVMLSVERAIFWGRLHGRARGPWLERLNAALRTGDRPASERLLRGDRSVYAELAARLLDVGASDAVAVETVERLRPRVDRFMTALSTIITAAPMLGILGTVLGIIRSFHLIGEQSSITDPRQVSSGIAEALLTTAAGLVVALVTLFPYMHFRVRIDRAVGRMEAIIASAQEGESKMPRPARTPARETKAPQPA